MDFIKGLCLLVLYACVLVHVLASPFPRPDSAGIVEMPPGLAYGGIPYGSVTGQVADYYGARQRSVGHTAQQPLTPIYY